jgi:competence ComEA-like helix-hairpin-helix protein
MKQPFIQISKRLERGTTVWLFICVILIFTPRVYMLLNPPELSYYWEYNAAEKAFKNRYQTTAPSTRKSTQLWKSCNPNELSVKDWQQLGLSPKQAASLIKYRDKYGLNSLKQMQQIRVLDQYILNRIKDSLRFEEEVYTSTNKSNQKVSPTTNNMSKQNTQITALIELKKLDLNSASIEELVALPGIGSYSAEKIIQYRQRLGGFISLDQLPEIKGLNPDMIPKMTSFLEIRSKMQPIALNAVTIERLKQHPYLSWNQANSIIKMRQQLGSFKSVEQIKQSVLIDEQTFEKLKPYLSL